MLLYWDMNKEIDLKDKFSSVWPHLNERARRMVAASEALSLGYGGISRVSRVCGLSRVTITKGIQELHAEPIAAGRVRRPGAGRPRLTDVDPSLPQELSAQDHSVSHEKVAQILRSMDYSLRGNRKTEEGDGHPDRDAQFRYINDQVRHALAAHRPVISVDTKKKELIGNYENKGQRWRKAKTPIHVNGHDFPDPSVPRAYPYGIYDLGRNTGFVNVGTDHDTSAFAVASIRGWWRAEGRRL